MRMQPEEIEAPIYSGWLVPWIRNRVSRCPVEIQRARAERIVDAAGHRSRHAFDPLVDFGGGGPVRPFGHVADPGDAGERQGFFADGDAVADRLAAVLHQIEVVIVGIDHDGAGAFLAVIVDDGAAERLGDRDLGVAGLCQLVLVVAASTSAPGPPGTGGLHAARQQQPGRQQSQFRCNRRHLSVPIESARNAPATAAAKAHDSTGLLSPKSPVDSSA